MLFLCRQPHTYTQSIGLLLVLCDFEVTRNKVGSGGDGGEHVPQCRIAGDADVC